LAEVEALAKSYAAPSPPEIREGRLNVCSMNASVDSPAYAVDGVRLRSISAGTLAAAVIPVGCRVGRARDQAQIVEGIKVGVSAILVHWPRQDVTFAVLSNRADGARKPIGTIETALRAHEP